MLRRIAACSAFALALVAASPTRADLIVTVKSTTAAAGSTGNWFDVTLTNDGSDAVELDGFSFGLDAGGSPDVVFTGVTTETSDAYIFDGHSAFGPDIALSTIGGAEAADAYDPIGGSILLAGGATVGLGRVYFDLADGASGTYTIVLSGFPLTSLSLGVQDVPVQALVDGTITVSAAIPEPSSIVMGLGATAALAACLRRRAA